MKRDVDQILAGAKRGRRAARVVNVRAETPAGYRWLLSHARGATLTSDGFLVTDESEWAQSLSAAGAREV